MDSVFPILNSAELPPYIWGNDEREKVRKCSSQFQNIALAIVFSVALNVSYLFNAAQNSNVCRMKGIGVSLPLLWKFKKRILYQRTGWVSVLFEKLTKERVSPLDFSVRPYDMSVCIAILNHPEESLIILFIYFF